MTGNALPPDVTEVLVQLLTEASVALENGDEDTARAALDTVERVTENKVPPGPQCDRLTHCCHRVEDRLDEAGTENIAAARESLQSMADRLTDSDCCD